MLNEPSFAFSRIAVLAVLLLIPSLALAAPGDDASAVVDRWATAFTANDTATVVNCYAPDATLLGMASPMLTQGTDAIRAYFALVLTNGNLVQIGERHVVVLGPDAVLVFGFYQFTLHVSSQPAIIPARFTMALVRRNGAWLILHHHSSVLPKPPQ